MVALAIKEHPQPQVFTPGRDSPLASGEDESPPSTSRPGFFLRPGAISLATELETQSGNDGFLGGMGFLADLSLQSSSSSPPHTHTHTCLCLVSRASPEVDLFHQTEPGYGAPGAGGCLASDPADENAHCLCTSYETCLVRNYKEAYKRRTNYHKVSV